jgi:hypothetical protein
VSDNITTNTWQGSAGSSGTAEPPPMTRRERREMEQREAEALAARTASTPVVEQPPATSPGDGVVEAAPAPVPVTRPTHEPPASPMTRRERREMEERMRAQEASTEQQVAPVPAPQPATRAVDTGVGMADDHTDWSPSIALAKPEIAVEPAVVQPSPAPLPPVFHAPVLPPRSGFPIASDDLDAEEAELASSREVGSGSPATHALILPTTPTMDIAGPIGDTGEILVTGQIPLPRLVTETGVQGELDDDERFDELIGAETTPLTSPVSARSAVSSKGNDSEFQMVRKAPWGTAATILGASAVMLVLAAAGLLTVALLTDLLTWPF